MPKRKSSAVWDYFEDIKVDDRRVWRCLLCRETRDFKGNTSNLWSHLANNKDEQHIEAHNAIKDKCLPARKKSRSDNVPVRLLDAETDVESNETEVNPVPSTSSSISSTPSMSSSSRSSAATSKTFIFNIAHLNRSI